jgi:ABC-2 type transport system ATP-binding protein
MDPKGRDEMLELIRDLAHNKGVNLIVSSHLLPDIEFTCDHVIVMDKGAVATQGALDAVRGPQGRVFELRVKDGAERMLELLTAAGYEVHDTQEDVMRVFVPGEAGAEPIFRLAAANGLQVRHLKQSVPTLEDAFARAVGAE